MRIESENATDHGLARGNRREALFRDGDRDRTEFLRRWEVIFGRMGRSIRAYVLVDNHYHPALHMLLPNLVEGMTWLQNAHTRYSNCRHREWGRVQTGGVADRSEAYHRPEKSRPGHQARHCRRVPQAHTGVGWTSGNHTGELVEFRALGPGSRHLSAFPRNLESHDLFLKTLEIAV